MPCRRRYGHRQLPSCAGLGRARMPVPTRSTYGILRPPAIFGQPYANSLVRYDGEADI